MYGSETLKFFLYCLCSTFQVLSGLQKHELKIIDIATYGLSESDVSAAKALADIPGLFISAHSIGPMNANDKPYYDQINSITNRSFRRLLECPGMDFAEVTSLSG